MSENYGKTIFDIAQEAGVSIATVSRALGSAPNLRSKKQKRALEVARKYNFKPSMVASGLNRGKMRMLGIVMPEITHPFYCEIFSTAEMEARERGYSVVFHRISGDSQGYQVILDRLVGQRLGGILLAGGLVENAKGPSKLEFLKLLTHYMPVVILGQPVEGFACACVTLDMAEGTRASVRHLHVLGHRRIAFLGGDPHNRSSGERESGYFEEMCRLNLPVDPKFLHGGGYTPMDGEVGALKLFGQLSRAQWPTAILAVNDLVALGAMRQLARMGLRVPEDVAIIGCDNQFFSAYTAPPLTTLDLCVEDSTRLAMGYLFDPPNVGENPMVHNKESQLIVRESCGAKLGRREIL